MMKNKPPRSVVLGVSSSSRPWRFVAALLLLLGKSARMHLFDGYPLLQVSALVSRSATFSCGRVGAACRSTGALATTVLWVSSASEFSSEVSFPSMGLAGRIPSSSPTRRRSDSPYSTQSTTTPSSRARYSTAWNTDPSASAAAATTTSSGSSFREWEGDFAALVAFLKRHGHLTIPKTEARLYRFVKNMRQNFKYLEQQQQRGNHEQEQQQHHKDHWNNNNNNNNNNGYERFTLASSSSSSSSSSTRTTSSTSYPTATAAAAASSYLSSASLPYLPSTRHSLTPDRIRRLESIGFTWAPRQDSWKCKYDQLYQFWKEHGHTSLPQDPEYRDLRSWMTYQRLRYRNHNNYHYEHGSAAPGVGSSSSSSSKLAPLSLEQIQLLGRIQFSWTPHDETWWKKFRQLESFHRSHGNFDVRGRENHKLRCWKNTLRRQCREYVLAVVLEGTADGVHVSGLNTERLEALRRIRFCWLPRAANNSSIGSNNINNNNAGAGPLMEEPPEDIFQGYQ